MMKGWMMKGTCVSMGACMTKGTDTRPDKKKNRKRKKEKKVQD
jgi:hypothetical protein